MTPMLSARPADLAPGLARIRAAGARIATSCARRWFLDRDGEFWLRELGLPWSLAAHRARVVAVVAETSDTRTLHLAPAGRWPGHRAGQHAAVELEVDGVRLTRRYSISSGGAAPGARRLAITVRRAPGGRASAALHALRPGAWIGLSDPAGDFVLPDRPGKLLLVAGGSGVTPIMAMVRDLPAGADAIVIHAAHRAADAIFAAELAAEATRRPGLRIQPRYRDRDGRLDAGALAALVPDLADREVFVCGPPGLIELVERCAGAASAAVHHERFAIAVPTTGEAATVTLLRTGDHVVAAGPGTLLAQLERAGQRPAHGCRIGICNTCRCRKRSGVVEDVTTGAVSGDGDETIRLCVSRARSDLALDL